MKVILLIPAYNESRNILKVRDTILTHNKSHHEKYDYIFINDGSTDSTEKILTENHIPHIELRQNLGIGGAMQTGYKYALRHNYGIAVQFDGDGQHDVEYIENIISPIIQEEADMVIGSRFINKHLDNFKSSALRRIGIKSISNVIKFKTGCRIYDTTSGFRAVNSKIIRLFAGSYPIEYPEPISTTTALLKKYSVVEVPAKKHRRAAGKSSISKFKSIYYMINVWLTIITLRRKHE